MSRSADPGYRTTVMMQQRMTQARPVESPLHSMIGSQVLLDLYDCDVDTLDDIEWVKKTLVDAARAAGAHYRGDGVPQVRPLRNFRRRRNCRITSGDTHLAGKPLCRSRRLYLRYQCPDGRRERVPDPGIWVETSRATSLQQGRMCPLLAEATDNAWVLARSMRVHHSRAASSRRNG